MGTLLRLLEALLLTGMGAFMVWLSGSSIYWQLLNPRYSWLTLTAGAIFVLLGIAHLFHAGCKGRVAQLLSIAIFLGLTGMAVLGPDTFTPPSPPPGGGYTGGSLTRSYDDEAPPPQPAITVDGVTYTRLNLAELLAGEDGGWTRENERYAVQGTVLRSPELDKAGYIAVVRLYVYCCFADAVGVVALVAVDDPTGYRQGTWVRVLGTLTRGAPFPGQTFNVTGAFSTARSDTYVITADQVKETAIEGVPFILDINREPPFAY
ncbi:hypothetical protein [Pseudodesulfovibrio sp.]|uniref:TIGR03943 family putative permease subunit n=1 Tax=unclassified Pseudodesulfovibrio TaxID=2661612 RepID=UPI003AFFEA26